MGGTHAVNIGVKNTDKIGFVAGLTAYFPKQELSDLEIEAINSLESFWLCMGKDNEWEYEQSKQTHEWFEQIGVSHEWIVTEGGHEWDVWRKNMIAWLPTLFQKN